MPLSKTHQKCQETMEDNQLSDPESPGGAPSTALGSPNIGRNIGDCMQLVICCPPFGRWFLSFLSVYSHKRENTMGLAKSVLEVLPGSRRAVLRLDGLPPAELFNWQTHAVLNTKAGLQLESKARACTIWYYCVWFNWHWLDPLCLSVDEDVAETQISRETESFNG